jgi:hypothetical protein
MCRAAVAGDDFSGARIAGVARPNPTSSIKLQVRRTDLRVGRDACPISTTASLPLIPKWMLSKTPYWGSVTIYLRTSFAILRTCCWSVLGTVVVCSCALPKETERARQSSAIPVRLALRRLIGLLLSSIGSG